MPCQAAGCTFNHNAHHCLLCRNDNSNHIAQNCPNINNANLFHGTTVGAAAAISQNGLQESQGGRMGRGVYFASKKAARNVAIHRNKENGNNGVSVVFICRVNLGNMRTLPTGTDDPNGTWRTNSFNSCHGMHPPWGGNTDHFNEFCVETNRVTIIGLELCNGTFNGNINLPGCDIWIRGNVTMNGSITAGNLNIGGECHL